MCIRDRAVTYIAMFTIVQNASRTKKNVLKTMIDILAKSNQKNKALRNKSLEPYFIGE